tara:strand:+ start:4212 stop:5546 length:1335 start_codon:yes stop_codon:yes gene_type:complete
MVITKDVAIETIINSLSEHFSYIETERHKEIDKLLDFYEGVNTDEYVKSYFGSETLAQIPVFNQNLTRRVIKARSMTYKRPPVMSVDERYENYVNIHDLNAKRRQLESLTYLLGCMAFRCRWDDATQKVEYENLTHFEPLFLPYEDKPFGIAYFVPSYGYSSDESQDMMIIWTEDRPGYQGRHFGIIDGKKVSFNDGDLNPYGIVPVVYTHRYPPLRGQFYSANAGDVVSADLHTSIAMTELALCLRFGAIGIRFVTGVDDASRIELGVDKLLYLPEGANFGITGPSASISQIIDGIKFYVSATLSNNHLRIKWADSHGNAPSGSALRIQEIENMEERIATTEDTYRVFEKKRYEIDKRIIEVQTNVSLNDDYTVDFVEPKMYLDPQEEINYWTWKFDQGLDNKENWYKYNNPDMSDEQIEEMVKKNEVEEPEPQNPLLNRLRS